MTDERPATWDAANDRHPVGGHVPAHHPAGPHGAPCVACGKVLTTLDDLHEACEGRER